MNKILCTTSSFGRSAPHVLEKLKEAGFEPVLNPYKRKLTGDELDALVQEYKPLAILAGTEEINSGLLEQVKGFLKVISRVGVGWDNVDKDAAKRFGIQVYRTEGVLDNAVGIYSAGTALAGNYSFLSRPIATSIKPEISKRLDGNDPNLQRNIKEFFMVFFQFSVFLYLAVSFFSKEIVDLLFNVRFQECYRIVPIVVLGLIFGELGGIFHLKLYFKNKTIWLPISTALAAIINAALNYYLIPKYDIYGAAFATSVTALIIMFFCYIVSQRLHRSEYCLFLNFIPLLIVIGLIFTVNSCNMERFSTFILKVILILIYGVGLDFFLRRYNFRYAELRYKCFAKVRRLLRLTGTTEGTEG